MQTVLRRDVPITTPNPWATDIYYEEVRLHSPHDPVRGPYVMPLVTLRTNPCRWSVSAGCVMCGYHLGAFRGLIEKHHLISQTEDAIRRLDSNTYPALVFTSNGSFLDPAEIPDDVRPELLRMLRGAGFRLLITESRPEYLSDQRLDEMVDAFSPETKNSGRHPISISFGLESVDDFVQRHCINKGRRRVDYERVFARLHERRFSFDCYVLLGKLFMTADEDIEDAIRTIRFAVDHGCEYVFVMVTNMVSYSLNSYLAERDRYRLPSLWRAVDLLERLPEKYRRAVQIKGISHAPVPPGFYAQTCPKCTEHVKGAINFWNQTAQFEHIRSIFQCECRPHYEATELAETSPLTLRERVRAEYHRLAVEMSIDPALINVEAGDELVAL